MFNWLKVLVVEKLLVGVVKPLLVDLPLKYRKTAVVVLLALVGYALEASGNPVVQELLQALLDMLQDVPVEPGLLLL